MIEGIGRFVDRKPKVEGKEYFQLVLYIPRDVAKDSQFPFRPGEDVHLKLEAGRMVVSKILHKIEHS
jgi:hypothetical protein